MFAPLKLRLKAEVGNTRQFLFSINNEKRRARENSRVRVVVGYSAYYAIFVHENAMAEHKVGEYKFLEKPARLLADRMALIIAENAKKRRVAWKGHKEAGELLLEESKKLVPVSEKGSGGNPPGFLRDSGFVHVEHK